MTLRHRGDNLRRIARSLPCLLTDATPEALESWQAALTVCLSSIATYTSHLRSFCEWLEEAGHCEANPARNLPQPKIPPRAPRPIPEADLALALECAEEPIKTWLLLAAYMGLRASEIAGITREGVREMADRLVITGIGKGQKSFTLPVPRELEPNLRQRLRQAVGPGALWRTRQGNPVTGHLLGCKCNKFLRRIGIPHTLHSLRHRLGTQLYAGTLDICLVQDVMRHGSPDTTRLYVAIGGERGAEALDQLARKTLRGIDSEAS